MKQRWIIILSLFALILSAQKPMPPADLLPDELTPKHQMIWVGSPSTPVTNSQDIISMVSRKLGYPQNVSLKLIQHRTSQTLEHYHFEVRFKGLKIFGGEIYVAVQLDGQIKLIQAPGQRFTNISGELPKPEDALLAKAMLEAQSIINTEVVLIPDGDFWQTATYVELAGPETLHREVLLRNGEMLYSNNLHKHFSNAGPGDTTVTVKVFDPDPLTTAQVSYGGNYSDNDDKNIGALNVERQQRNTIFTFQNGLFKPENDFVKITEFSDPITAQIAKPSNDFNYTRDRAEFEDVNVVYHITHIRQHIQALGYPNLPSYQVQVDAHALNGSDQSFFATSVFPYRLYFGEGGVDDAEDADVIIHEFAHAVIYEAAPTGSKDTERKCIEEALCDYFAASYSRQVSSFGANDVFNWDGHNEFWPGRTVNTGMNYVQASFKNGNYYAHTDIMASTLNELYRRLGRSITDQLVLEASYLLTSSTEMPNFGRYMLLSDSLLNGAANIRAISESFVQHGILNQVIDLPEVLAFEESDLQIFATQRFTDGGQVQVTSTNGLVGLSLHDLNGREIFKQDLRGRHQYFLTGDDFRPGVYIIRVENQKGAMLTQKLLRH